MSQPQNQTSERWTSGQAYTLAVICLLLGVAGGWIVRGSAAPVSASTAVQTAAPATPNAPPSTDQMLKMANTQAAPLLEKLSADPANVELLASIGNIYYDAQQYPTAIDYYQRALNLQPSTANVRTDMATAYWYTGNADRAIEEFNKALIYQPNNANTLFNLGIVKWQGKMDIAGAIAVWQKLLDTNPNYEGKEKVAQLIAQAGKHSDLKPKANPAPE